MSTDEATERSTGLRSRLIRMVLWIAALAGVAALAVGTFFLLPYGAAATVVEPALGIVDDQPGLPSELEAPAERSVVLADDGSVLATLSGSENRITVGIDEVPDEVVAAVLAIEDADFYEHAGIDHRALARAMWVNLRAGGIVQGGSTITQQYVKNTVLTADRTLDRKTTEMRYAIELERRMSKDEILEGYLNEVYFGEGVYGIATAAEYYFSRDLDELSVDEAALLAGLIQQPAHTNPVANEDAATARRDTVLVRMAEEGFLSTTEMQQAIDAEVELDITPLPPPDNPFFVDHVTEQLFADEALGESREERQQLVFTGGLEIHTTLDPALQSAAEAAISDTLTDAQADPLSTMVTIEPGTGAVRALAVGPKAYGPCEEDDETECETTQVNPAVPGLGGSGRQPGSAFKPVVLAAALQEGMPRGWEEETDSELEIDGCDDYAPRNFDPDDGGDKAMAEAIRVSNNVYHAQLIGELQPGPVVDMAQRLGIPDRDLPEECSLALGTATLFPIDLLAAIATLANQGERCEPFAVARIEQDGEVLREREPDCTEAVDAELALSMTDLLREPVEAGTATAAQLDRPVAGKTGTTDDFRDAWFVGYVPQLATVAWVGFEDQQPMRDVLGHSGVTGGSIPAELWVSYMREAVADLEVESFEEPPPAGRLEVPDAIDRDVDDVVDDLGTYDLHVEVEEVTDFRDEGTVVEQEPSGGTEVARGSFFRLQVSDGTGAPPAVPDVVGADEAEASTTLQDAGYEVAIDETRREVTLGPEEAPADLDPPEGAVVEQDPAGGSPLEPDAVVTLTVVRYEITEEEPPTEEPPTDEPPAEEPPSEEPTEEPPPPEEPPAEEPPEEEPPAEEPPEDEPPAEEPPEEAPAEEPPEEEAPPEEESANGAPDEPEEDTSADDDDDPEEDP